MSDPLVSIVLPVYEGGRWLRRALASVGDQSESDFELIALDDGSSDATPAILADWARRDGRLRVVTRPHRGLVACLNHGLELARGRFVARLDADDWWARDRLARQLAFLRANPDCGIVGSAIWHADASGRLVRRALRPQSDLMIRWKALIWCPFTHSAVLLRRPLLEAHGLRYDPRCEGAEDYDLWLRLLGVTRAHNLPERLVVKRLHESTSVARAREIVPIRTAISRRAIASWAPDFEASDRELVAVRDAFHAMGRARLRDRPDRLRVTAKLLDLLESFARAHPGADGLDEIADCELGRIQRDLEPSWNRLALWRIVARGERLRPGFRAGYRKRRRERARSPRRPPGSRRGRDASGRARTLEPLRLELGPELSALREQIAAAGPADVTVLCLPRHGFGTTKVTIESLYANTGRRFKTIVADIHSPPGVRSYLEQQAKEREGFFPLRIDEFVSRQTARLLALELVDSPYVLFIDNNMLVSQGWLENLLAAARETGAAIVQPVLVTQGGDIHFSGGFVVEGARGIKRPHFQPGGPTLTRLADAKLERLDIDFAESHCCLARTDAMRIPDVLKECTHNAQTLCCAGYTLRHELGEKVIVEPTAVASIVPISFGYDLPWMCLCYMDPDLLASSYAELVALIGPGPSNDLESSLPWHRKHFRYLLATMASDGRLARQDLLEAHEIPGYIVGYDHDLPGGADRVIRERVVPYVEQTWPELRSRLEHWLR